MEPVATHELSGVKVRALTLVKRGANRRVWSLFKAGEPEVTLPAPHDLLKGSADWKTAYVVVAAPGWVEQGGQGAPGIHDVWKSEDEIADAAHGYLLEAGYVNKGEHGSPSDPALKVVESFVAPSDLTLGGEVVLKGSWVVGVRLDDATREMVEKGEITGVSIEGTGMRTAVGKAAPSERSVMVALYPPADVANGLAVDGGEHPADLHVTLAYLGDIPDDRLHLVAEAVATAVDRMDTDGLTGEIAGGGTFTGGEKPVHYASVDAPSLPELRQKVIEALSDHGVPARADHGFTPHMTLKFGRGATPRVASQPVRFDAVHVVRGDRDVASLPLRPHNARGNELLGKAGLLDRSPKHNWVEDAGGLPPYIEQIALALERGGKSLKEAIPIAISRVKRWAAGGDGVSQVVQAKAAAAMAQWEALKSKNKTTSKVTKMLDRLRKLMDPKTTEADLDDEDRRLIAKILEEGDPRSGTPAPTIEKTDPKLDEENPVDETKLAEALAKAMEPTLTKVNDRLDAVEKALAEKPVEKAEEPKPTAESLEKAMDELVESFVPAMEKMQKSLESLTAGGSTQAPSKGGEQPVQKSSNPLAGIL